MQRKAVRSRGLHLLPCMLGDDHRSRGGKAGIQHSRVDRRSARGVAYPLAAQPSQGVPRTTVMEVIARLLVMPCPHCRGMLQDAGQVAGGSRHPLAYSHLEGTTHRWQRGAS